MEVSPTEQLDLHNEEDGVKCECSEVFEAQDEEHAGHTHTKHSQQVQEVSCKGRGIRTTHTGGNKALTMLGHNVQTK